jgi:hypothetical protein
MALATLHVAAIPVLAGLVAGTGAVAAFVSGGGQPVQTAAISSTQTPQTGKSCDAQTWPYIEQRCLAGKASTENRPVRLVTAPSSEPGQQSNMAPATPNAGKPAPDSGNLVSRDTVLRAPNYYNSIPAVPDNLASDQRLTRKQMRREVRKQRTDRRWVAQSYQVPGEFDRRSARPIVVVRPLRLDTFR